MLEKIENRPIDFNENISDSHSRSISISGDGTAVFGMGKPGDLVKVIGHDGTELGASKVRVDGGFRVGLDVPQKNGEMVAVSMSSPDGSVSTTDEARAPDFTPPSAVQGLEIHPEGGVVSGHGAVPGAPVRVLHEKSILGVSLADHEGKFVVPLDEVRINSEELRVYAFDAAGNRAEAASVVAPDLTAPQVIHARISGDGMTVDGVTEAGSKVTVHRTSELDPETVLTATTADRGQFYMELPEALTNGEKLFITVQDEAGNSRKIEVLSPDLRQPEFSGELEFIGEQNTVHGKTEVAAKVTVFNTADEILGEGKAGEDGAFSVKLTTEPAPGEQLTVLITDAAGNAAMATVMAAYPLAEEQPEVSTVVSEATAGADTDEITDRDASTATSHVDTAAFFARLVPDEESESGAAQEAPAEISAAGPVDVVALNTFVPSGQPVGLPLGGSEPLPLSPTDSGLTSLVEQKAAKTSEDADSAASSQNLRALLQADSTSEGVEGNMSGTERPDNHVQTYVIQTPELGDQLEGGSAFYV